ncbi:MAG TPA: CBS domain-containing protein, partial [Candidatus Accumulibacter phosphatis]|nr:CBS domain-containing protein [Candidatus Accumulibacter phosphatis]
MKTLRQILADKSGPLMSVSPDDPVFYALQVMSDANVGALLVLDGEQLVGIFSERDYARKVILFGKASKDTPVRAIMTDKVLYVTPDRTVDECMAIMTDKHIRHLPVLDDEGKVLGIVSIGDVVKETICEQ